MYTLTKWYLDGVDDAGRVVVAYWAHLAKGRHGLTWHALTEYAPDEPVQHAWSVASVEPPRRENGHLAWQADALDTTITMEAADRPHDVCLLENSAGAVTWRGETMAARLRLTRKGRPSFEGDGYAECLTMTIAPWLLPIDRLEWGRWIGSDRRHASTWFRWHGAHPLQHVVEDGRDATNVDVDGASVTTATSALEISTERQLERRGLREIVARVPGIEHFLPNSLLALEETQWLGRGMRRDADGTTHLGWAIYETVQLR